MGRYGSMGGLMVGLIKQSRENGQIQAVDDDHGLCTTLFQHALQPPLGLLSSHYYLPISIFLSILLSIVLSIVFSIVRIVPFGRCFVRCVYASLDQSHHLRDCVEFEDHTDLTDTHLFTHGNACSGRVNTVVV